MILWDPLQLGWKLLHASIHPLNKFSPWPWRKIIYWLLIHSCFLLLSELGRSFTSLHACFCPDWHACLISALCLICINSGPHGVVTERLHNSWPLVIYDPCRNHHSTSQDERLDVPGTLTSWSGLKRINTSQADVISSNHRSDSIKANRRRINKCSATDTWHQRAALYFLHCAVLTPVIQRCRHVWSALKSWAVPNGH